MIKIYMQLLIKYILPISLLISSLAPFVQADEQTTFRVAIKPSEPWVMYDAKLPPEERKPVGFSIDLWEGIAKEIGVKTQWVYQKNVPDLLSSVQENRADAGIAAITIRSDREKVVDFSTSMFELGLQIMVKDEANVSYPLTILITEISKFITTMNLTIFLLQCFV